MDIIQNLWEWIATMGAGAIIVRLAMLGALLLVIGTHMRWRRKKTPDRNDPPQ